MAGVLGFDFKKKDKQKNGKSGETEQPADQIVHQAVQAEIPPDNPREFMREKENEHGFSAVIQIPVKDIIPNPNQPRTDFNESALYSLAQSIQNYGIIQPLTVRRLETVSLNSPPVYELIAGERRLRAASVLCMETVPCVVTDASKQLSAEIALIENLQREDLNFFEQGLAIFKLIDQYSYTQEQIARKLAVSQSYIANKLRILKLTPEEQDTVIREGLTERHARSLIRIQNSADRKAALETIVKRNMNVSAAEKYIEKLLLATKTAKQRNVLILRDIRLFLNSIDKAVDIVSQSGITIKSEKIDRGEYIEVNLTVPKNKT